MRTRRVSKAFTLVEILIVVVILGILAAIVVPQFTNATDDSRRGNIATQESTIENQLELCRAREGTYPAFDATLWDHMIDNGYLKARPENPFTPEEDDGTAVGALDSGAAWEIYLDENDNAVVDATGDGVNN